MLQRTNSTSGIFLSGKSFDNQALVYSPKTKKRLPKVSADAFGARTDRFTSKTGSESPGPGRYYPYRPVTSCETPGIAGFGIRVRFSNELERLESFRPGPGSYTPTIDGCFSQHRRKVSPKKRKQKIQNKKKISNSSFSHTPGPGHYYPYGPEESRAWEKSFSYSFKSIGRCSDIYSKERRHSLNGAPGRYDVEHSLEALKNYGRNVGLTGAAFRSKTDRWKESKRPGTTPAPGQYEVNNSDLHPYIDRPLSVFSSALDRFGMSPYRTGQDDDSLNPPGPGWYNPRRIDCRNANGALAVFKSKTKRSS